ncbi:MAG: vWA domain-containing protein [Anaeromyxobacter sp.]
MTPTRLKAWTWTAALAASLALTSPPAGAAQAPPAHPRPVVQLALLLDTSNSMDGLIDQARVQLWKVVNTLSAARRGGVRPDLRIALYEYGNDGLPAGGHWIRLVTPFTSDLDLVSERLFALTTNGGQEYCGAVIDRALHDLDWSRSADDLKLVFIAGNEPFTQGPVEFRRVVRQAASRGITVNTIHCGPEGLGVETGWRDGALLSGGAFTTIDQDRVAVDPPAPQDAELVRLNEQLNRTYLAYGALGKASQERQAAQDANAAKMSSSALAARTSSKAGAYYTNSGWDLVDGVRDGRVKLEALKADDLPEELRRLPPGERRAYVDARARERAALQQRIAALSVERGAFLAKARAAVADAGQGTLDAAMLQTVKVQAAKKQYTLD